VIWIWTGVVIALVLVELISRKAAAGCFAVSATISAIMTFFTKETPNTVANVANNTNNYIIQLGTFLILGFLLLLFVRPFVLQWVIKCKKLKKEKKT